MYRVVMLIAFLGRHCTALGRGGIGNKSCVLRMRGRDPTTPCEM